jgi:hypothetical protein
MTSPNADPFAKFKAWASFAASFEALAAKSYDDNAIHMQFLMTRTTKSGVTLRNRHPFLGYDWS